MRTKHLIFGVTAVAGSLLLVGCGPAEEAPQSEPLQSAPTESEPAEDQPIEGEIDALRAVEIALDAEAGTVVDLELDENDSRIIWEVGILTSGGQGLELDIDRNSGEVVKQEDYDLSSEQRTAPEVLINEAIGIALDAVSGSVTSAELDSEDGRVVWEMNVNDGSAEWDLEIDAATGEVVKQDQDD